jgi:hypothetical protein
MEYDLCSLYKSPFQPDITLLKASKFIPQLLPSQELPQILHN